MEQLIQETMNTNGDNIDLTEFLKALSRPDLSENAIYNATDSAGNAMQCISIIGVSTASYKYVAVYHTPTLVNNNEYMYNINLSGSNDLTNWEFIKQLVSNADMPEIRRTDNSDWIVLVHEQWQNTSSNGGSASPSKIGFKLFYNDENLVNGTINSTWEAPLYETDLNGTPNIYNLTTQQDQEGWWYVSGSIGFHFWNGQRDLVANASLENIFNPNENNPPSWSTSTAADYNQLFINAGVTGNIGQRTNIKINNKRYNIQEGNIGLPASSWAKWRLFLYQYNDTPDWPTGNGEIFCMYPQTPNQSKSFGNPRISIVTSPTDSSKKSVVISYFIFSEDSGANEPGGLLYYFDI